jgi:Mn2+/Fe2+ NRAMP family transporter
MLAVVRARTNGSLQRTLRYERVDVVVGAAVVFLPGLALVPVLVLTQVLNAVLLLPLLVVVQRFARDPELMGPYRNGRRATLAAAAAFAIVAASVIGLALSVVLRG